MKYSDINTGSIYNVDFDPVRPCEFNKIHLALVLKKNNDKKTAIVLPLTSASNGNNVNKINLGKLNCLPTSLKTADTYAVYNQIRTVNANRFIRLKEFDENGNNNPIDCKLEDAQFDMLLKLAIGEICFSYDIDKKMDLYLSLYNQEKLKKCIALAYTIKQSETESKTLQSELASLLYGFQYTLSQTEINNGIDTIFKNALKTLDTNGKFE